MFTEIPFWYQIIYYWCRSKNRYGLTIPFILGALTIKKPRISETSLTNIENLFNQITKYAPKEKVIFRYCDDLNEYVFDLDNQFYPLGKIAKNEGLLIIHPDISDRFTSLNALIKCMQIIYEPIIEQHLFSKNIKTNTWEPYSEDEIEMFKNIYSI